MIKVVNTRCDSFVTKCVAFNCSFFPAKHTYTRYRPAFYAFASLKVCHDDYYFARYHWVFEILLEDFELTNGSTFNRSFYWKEWNKRDIKISTIWFFFLTAIIFKNIILLYYLNIKYCFWLQTTGSLVRLSLTFVFIILL